MQKQPPDVFYKKTVPQNFEILTGKHQRCSLILKKLKACNFLKTQVFSCEYCEIFNNYYFEEHLRAAAFEHGRMKMLSRMHLNMFDAAKLSL